MAGPHLDAIARRPLWSIGLDYDHGTGHGVGSYLSVHEGPVSISRAARPVPAAVGMILSNEPGFYAQGAYGIRLETLLMVQPADLPGPRPFLRFEVLTLAPFDRALIDPGAADAGGAGMDRCLSRPSRRRGWAKPDRRCPRLVAGGMSHIVVKLLFFNVLSRNAEVLHHEC